MFGLVLLLSMILIQASQGCQWFRIPYEDSGRYVNISAFLDTYWNVRINVSLADLLEQADDVEIVITEGNQMYSVQSRTGDSYLLYLNETTDDYKRVVQLSLPQLNITRDLDLACTEFCCIICSTMIVELSNLTRIAENDYVVSISTNTSSNLEPMIVEYSETSSKLTYRATNGTITDDGLQFTMDHLQSGGNYQISFIYYDKDNDYCKDKATISFEVQKSLEPITQFKIAVIVLLLAFVVFTVVFVLMNWRRITTLLMKFKHGHFDTFSDNGQDTGHSKLEKLRFGVRSAKEVHNPMYSPWIPQRQCSDDTYEISREQVENIHVLDSGHFGIVYMSKVKKLNGRKGYALVAVKVLKDNTPDSELASFRNEIELQKKIGRHRNVVRMLACVTKTQPNMIVMELVLTGNLFEYLEKLRDIWEKNKETGRFFASCSTVLTGDGEYVQPETEGGQFLPNQNVQKEECRNPEYLPCELLRDGCRISPTSSNSLDDYVIMCASNDSTPLLEDVSKEPEPALNHKELEDFAYQIACGMKHLESKGIVHRDLRARNVLITYNKTLKVSDFGLSREAPYVTYGRREIPLRWKAIEALETFKEDSKSDVWSYGIVLWEIGMLAAFPYKDIPNDYILPFLQSGQRLQKPVTCTDDHYSVMMSCWDRDPYRRPTFAELEKHFKAAKCKAYVDFGEIHPGYVFPPTGRRQLDGKEATERGRWYFPSM